MIAEQISFLRKITEPFAIGSGHVQGPGGNTSVKSAGKILIKASGYTFKDVIEGNGLVVLDNAEVVETLKHYSGKASQTGKPLPVVLESVPPLARPSMEYEFHSLLNNYVLHTHSVYANIINCSIECEELLKTLFAQEEYLLIPYVTPGFPIAAHMVNLNKNELPAIIFLKNHGIIVHANTAEEVLSKYNYVQEVICKRFSLTQMPELASHYSEGQLCLVKAENVYGKMDIMQIADELLNQVLIPDQSIFFRNKLSAKPGAEVYLDYSNDEIIIRGSWKFVEAAKSMLQAVFFIRKNIQRLGMNLHFISAEDINILHNLDSEKYRTSLLNK